MLIAILAAGSARRFGDDKLAADCAGKPLGQWALDAALAIGAPTVWIGGESKPAWVAPPCEFIPNPDAASGLASSLRVAARCANEARTASLLVMLADMPLVDPPLLRELIAAGPLAACAYPDGRTGVPALFPAAYFPRLAGLTGDHGAGALLRDAPGLRLIHPTEGALADVDTLADLAEAAARLSARSG